jgi:hypothetical protein
MKNRYASSGLFLCLNYALVSSGKLGILRA